MRKGILLHGFLSFWVLSAFAEAPLPHLTDVVIEGTVDAPFVSPAELQFQVGLPYLLVVINEKPVAISLYYGKFGQKVSTQSLYGTSSLSQESLVLNPNSKLQWYFIPQEAGEFPFYVTNNGFNLHKKEGKIVVKKVETEQKSSQLTTQIGDASLSAKVQKNLLRKSSGHR